MRIRCFSYLTLGVAASFLVASHAFARPSVSVLSFAMWSSMLVLALGVAFDVRDQRLPLAAALAGAAVSASAIVANVVFPEALVGRLALAQGLLSGALAVLALTAHEFTRGQIIHSLEVRDHMQAPRRHRALTLTRLEPLRPVCVLAVLLLVAACSSCGDSTTPPTTTPTARTPEARTPDTKRPKAKTPEARTPDASSPACRDFDPNKIKSPDSLEVGGDLTLWDQVLAWWPLIGPFVNAYGSVIVAGVGITPVHVRDEKGRLIGAFTLFVDSVDRNRAVGLEMFDRRRVPCRWAVASLHMSPDRRPGDPFNYDLGVGATTLGADTADILKVRRTASAGPRWQRIDRLSIESQSGAPSPEIFAALLTVLRERLSFTDEPLRGVEGLDRDPDIAVAFREPPG